MAEIINNLGVEDLFPTDSEEIVDTQEPISEEGEEITKKTSSKPIQPLAPIGNIDDLFPDDDGSSENENEEEEEEEEKKGKGKQSSSDNDYLEFAKALRDEGVFDDLDDDDFEDITDASGIKSLIQKQISAGLDEAQKEVLDALRSGVDPESIQSYAAAMSSIDQLETSMSAEDENGKRARAQIIYADYINKGFTDKKAKSLLEASFKAGTDIDDAEEALESLKTFYTDKYNNAVEEAKEEQQKVIERRNKEEAKLKKTLLEKKTLFEGIDLDTKVRKAAYDAVAKPIKDANGVQTSAVGKFAEENPVEFRTMLGLVYALTDGYTKLDKLFTKAVDKKVHSKLDDITRKLTSSKSQNGGGGIMYKNNHSDDLGTNRWRVYV